MKAWKKPIARLLALLIALAALTATLIVAQAAGDTMTTYNIDLPRSSDPNKSGWGNPDLEFLGGWSITARDYYTVHVQDAYNGRAVYCIEPGGDGPAGGRPGTGWPDPPLCPAWGPPACSRLCRTDGWKRPCTPG